VRRALLGSVVLAVATAGCGMGFETKLGPGFQPSRAEGAGVVYFYRPSELMGARTIVHVVVDGEERLLLTGGYVAMRVPPGKHRVYAYSTPEWQYYVGYGYGPSRWRGEADVDVAADRGAFVRIATPIGSVAMEPKAEDAAMPELATCGLSPGGALR
jgi:hypothetical protein